jgi:thiol:disulfide interchange protein DsbA
MGKMMNRLIIFVLLALSGHVFAAEYEEGTHYVALEKPIETEDPEKIEVTEYFFYGCSHCFEFDPAVALWVKNQANDVIFNRTPVTWAAPQTILARTYYTAEALGVLEKIHLPLFQAVQQQRVNSPESIALFFGEHGIDPVDFARMFASFPVDRNTREAAARGKAYGLAVPVPAMIVNGKYRIEGSMAGGNANMLRVVSYLVEQERQAKAAAEVPAEQ